MVRTLVRTVRTLPQKRLLFSQVRTIRTSARAQIGEFGTECRQSGRRSSFQTSSRGCHVAPTSTPARGLGTTANTAPARGPLWCAQTDGPCAEISVEHGTPARPTRRPSLTQTRGSRAGLPRFVDGEASVPSTAREQLVFLLVTWLIRSNQKRRFLLSPIRVGGAPREIRGVAERAGAHPLDCEAQRRLMSDSATASSAPCSMSNDSGGAGPLVGRGAWRGQDVS